MSRAHFARHIVSTGLMADVQTVFQYYLAKGKPGYVEHEWAALPDAVRWIRAGGGVAVIAHPGRYRLAGGELEALLEEFVALWRRGVEVVSGWNSPGRGRMSATLARRYGLLVGRLSDFTARTRVQPTSGGCEKSTPDLEPVWTVLRQRRIPQMRRNRKWLSFLAIGSRRTTQPRLIRQAAEIISWWWLQRCPPIRPMPSRGIPGRLCCSKGIRRIRGSESGIILGPCWCAICPRSRPGVHDNAVLTALRRRPGALATHSRGHQGSCWRGGSSTRRGKPSDWCVPEHPLISVV